MADSFLSTSLVVTKFLKFRNITVILLTEAFSLKAYTNLYMNRMALNHLLFGIMRNIEIKY